tara:strand:+ start:308 stop:493 length:186 start_codon:yes stop_codon:yes gene_type:complete
MNNKERNDGLLAKGGKWGAIFGVLWIGVNIIVPLALLRVPAVQKFLISLEDKLPFDIPGVG